MIAMIFEILFDQPYLQFEYLHGYNAFFHLIKHLRLRFPNCDSKILNKVIVELTGWNEFIEEVSQKIN